ncbi:MAG: hypothetical protein FD129_3445, partial [bacterium]
MGHHAQHQLGHVDDRRERRPEAGRGHRPRGTVVPDSLRDDGDRGVDDDLPPVAHAVATVRPNLSDDPRPGARVDPRQFEVLVVDPEDRRRQPGRDDQAEALLRFAAGHDFGREGTAILRFPVEI